MAELLAIDNATTASDDFDITITGAVFLTSDSGGVPPTASASVQVKASNDAYITIGWLDAMRPYLAIPFPGTYRVQRFEGATIGVDSQITAAL